MKEMHTVQHQPATSYNEHDVHICTETNSALCRHTWLLNYCILMHTSCHEIKSIEI